jgi:hypothetical protein
MIIIWLLSGIAVVSLAFFIPPNSPELWPSLNMAAIPIVLYLLALGLYTLRSPITLKARIIAWVSILLVGAAMGFSWTGMEDQSHWQHNQLLKIHSVITRGILLSTVPPYELNALQEYHKQGSKKKESLGQIFQRQNNGASTGTNIYKAEIPMDSTSIVIKSLADNEVVLLGLHAYSKGRNPEFKNYNGKTGRVQERYTLTEKGIVYESEN